MATTTVRLPEPLKAEADALAASLGISLNALMAVALRDYLDRPVTRPSGGPLPSRGGGDLERAPPRKRGGPASRQTPGPVIETAMQEAPMAPTVALAAPLRYRPPHSRSDPCPCGARDRNDYPVKWKHCHGRADGQA